MNKGLTNDIIIEQMEIRDFYKSWNLRRFDPNFAEYANTHDLVIFGGGAFWEPRWDYSETGTTLDLSDETLNILSVPVLFLNP